MSDNAAESTPAQGEATTSEPAASSSQPETDWKVEARKWEARAKENSTAAARLAEAQQGQASLMAKLAEALGVAPDKQAPDDLVSTLQQKVAAMELDREVERLGRLHPGLTDDDLDTLRELPDPAVRTKVAERLAAAASTKPGIPKPDRSVGKGGSGKAEGGSVSAGRDLYQGRRSKSNQS